MKIRLTNQVAQSIPGLNAAVLVFKGIKNEKKRSDVSQLLRGLIAGKKKEFKNEEKKAQINEFLRHTIIDNRILPETRLLKSNINKIATGKDIASANSLTDFVHYLSVKNIIPMLAVDLDQTEKDLEIDLIVPRQGQKAAEPNFGKETKNIAIWLIDTGSIAKEDFEKIPDEFAKLITRYFGGTLESKYMLNADNREFDLGYTSEKEIEYIEIRKKLEEERALKEQILVGDEAPFIGEGDSGSGSVQSVKEKLQQAIRMAMQKITETKEEVKIESPADSSHGDYAVNIALKLAKSLQRAPMEIAQEILDNMPKPDFVEKMEVAAPGFINFRLTTEHFKTETEKILKLKSGYGRLRIGSGQKVLVEYSSPNIAKPLGVHHLLSTIIGQTLSDLLRFSGYEVVSVNWPGDWGTQFGKLLYAYKNWGEHEVVMTDPLNELLKLYVRFHNEAEADPALEDKGREEFKKLEEGDEQNNNLWQWIRDLSIEEIERIYVKLGVKFDVYLGERMYLDAAKEIVKEGLEKGIISIGEKGALIIQYEDEKYSPLMMQKADGTTLYATRDLASIKDRLAKWNPGKILYVVDVAQSLHFKQLFEAAQKYGMNSAELVHIVFGRMQLPEGRMSTRSGDVVLLDELIKEGVSRTQKLVDEKSPELPDTEREYVANAMAISAIKYNIISQNRETNMTFEWDKMLSLDGNSGPYLQYAYARAQSILRKCADSDKAVEIKPKDENQTDLFSFAEVAAKAEKPAAEEEPAAPFMHASEQRLMRLLPRFPEYVELAVRDYKPNLLTNYLFDLTRAFSNFYNEVSVINAGTEEHRQARIRLVRAFSTVLYNGMKTLGIAVFERM
jgi:arginyl-tRNA synthetase